MWKVKRHTHIFLYIYKGRRVFLFACLCVWAFASARPLFAYYVVEIFFFLHLFAFKSRKHNSV